MTIAFTLQAVFLSGVATLGAGATSGSWSA